MGFKVGDKVYAVPNAIKGSAVKKYYQDNVATIVEVVKPYFGGPEMYSLDIPQSSGRYNNTGWPAEQLIPVVKDKLYIDGRFIAKWHEGILWMQVITLNAKEAKELTEFILAGPPKVYEVNVTVPYEPSALIFKDGGSYVLKDEDVRKK